MKAWWLGGALVAVLGSGARAQPPLRAGLMEKPKVGSKAPEFELPYFTAAGPGPADQPFRSAAELGRVLVVVFGPVGDAGWWQAIGAVADTAWRGAYPVGVVRGQPGEVARLAAGMPTDRLKLLADPAGEAGRRYGVGRRSRAAFVIADDGSVAHGEGNLDLVAGPGFAAISGVLRRLAP